MGRVEADFLSGTDTSLTTDWTSGDPRGHDFITGSLFVKMTGTPAGTLKVQCTNDGTNWVDHDTLTTTVTTAGDFIFNISKKGWRQTRVYFARTSGTYSVTVAKSNWITESR